MHEGFEKIPDYRFLKHGEIIKINPISGLDRQLIVRVLRCYADRPLPASVAAYVRRLEIKDCISNATLHDALHAFKGIPEEYEEIWHKDYGEIDSGNQVDSTGSVSALLDVLADSLGWPKASPRFDKLHFRKHDDYSLGFFHADHFHSEPARTRSLGTMDRVIFNLGDHSRWFAILLFPKELVRKTIHDPYCKMEYLKLMLQEEGVRLALVETPAKDDCASLNGLFFNALDTIHCGFGGKGDFAAILSHWLVVPNSS